MQKKKVYVCVCKHLAILSIISIMNKPIPNNSTMKHLYRFIGVVVLTIISSLTASAQNIIGAAPYYYADNGDGTVYLYSCLDAIPAGYTGDVTIPSTIKSGKKTYTVTAIGAKVFLNKTELTGITIPASVTKIYRNAFEGCTGLKTVRLEGQSELTLSSDSNTDYPFRGCKVENLYIERDLSSWQALCNTSSLKSVQFGNNVTSIGDRAFSNCTGLVEIAIPASVTSFGTGIFKDCTNLDKVTLPASLTSIPSETFSGCTALSTFSIPSGVTSIDEKAFYNCSDFTTLSFPASVKTIARQAFYGCKGLTSLTIPATISDIASEAFSYCSGIKTLTIEDSKSELSFDASISSFSNCKVQTLYVGRNLSRWASLSNSSELTSVRFGKDVTAIGDNAFFSCKGLTQITIPETITELGYQSFFNCQALTSVKIPASISVLPDNVFKDCVALTEMTIPKTVNSIGSGAFMGCTGITSLTIEDSESELELTPYSSTTYKSFSGCKVQTLYVGRNLSPWSGLSNGSSLTSVTFNDAITSIGDEAFLNCRGLTEVTIPSAVTSIGASAFEYTRLREVSIPAAVTSIGAKAFYMVNTLRTFIIEDSDTELTLADTDNIFSACPIQDLYIGRNLSPWSSLRHHYDGPTSVTLGSNVTSIGASAFLACTGLSEFTVPATVTSIGADAFKGCSSLKTLCLLEGAEELEIDPTSFTNAALDDVMVGRNITGATFGEISSLTKAWVTDGVTTLPDDMFRSATALTNAYIGDGVTNLPEGLFSECIRLKLLQLGKNVGEIAKTSLNACTGLTDIYAEGMVPPTVAAGGFGAIDYPACVLHYPLGAPYLNTSPWVHFFNNTSLFGVTMKDEYLKADTGDEITVTALVDSDVDPTQVVWRSSNPSIAEIIEGEAPLADAQNEISAKVRVKNDSRVTVAAFLPTGEMANCIINGPAPSAIDTINASTASSTLSDGIFTVHNLQGILIMRTGDAARIATLSPGLYIINGHKVLLK